MKSTCIVLYFVIVLFPHNNEFVLKQSQMLSKEYKDLTEEEKKTWVTKHTAEKKRYLNEMEVYKRQIREDAVVEEGPILKHVVVGNRERFPKNVVVKDKEQILENEVVEGGLRRILKDVGVMERENKSRKKEEKSKITLCQILWMAVPCLVETGAFIWVSQGFLNGSA